MKEKKRRVGIWENRLSLPQCMCRIFHKRRTMWTIWSPRWLKQKETKFLNAAHPLQAVHLLLHQWPSTSLKIMFQLAVETLLEFLFPVFSEEYMDIKDIYSKWNWYTNSLIVAHLKFFIIPFVALAFISIRLVGHLWSALEKLFSY